MIRALRKEPPVSDKKACIVIDAWKLPIFSRNLVAKGYHYAEGPGLTPGTLLLTVTTDNLQALAQTVLAANTEAAHTGKPR